MRKFNAKSPPLQRGILAALGLFDLFADLKSTHMVESRGPEHVENTGFRLPPE